MTKEEFQLERDIEAAFRVLVDPLTERDVRLTANETMCRLIALRSPRRVAEMERAKGLA